VFNEREQKTTKSTKEFKQDAETFEKCSISFKFKEGDNFNHRNTLSISRIALKLDFVQNLSQTPKLGERGRCAKVSCCQSGIGTWVQLP
jgi:hypothetical protein